MKYRNVGIMMYGMAISVNIVFVTSFTVANGIVIAYDHYNGTEEFEDIESTFGSSIPDNGMLGVLVSAEPHDGCLPLKAPPFPSGFNQRNVTLASFALIVRGNCEFGTKMLNAQNSGYLAAVVYNDESDLLIKMSTSVGGITIPSVFVGLTAGVILNSTYLYDKQGQPYIQLYEGSFNPLEYYLIPFVIVLAVCFVSLLCFMMQLLNGANHYFQSFFLGASIVLSPNIPFTLVHEVFLVLTVLGTSLFIVAIMRIVKCCRDRRRQRRGRLSLERLKKLPVKNFEKGDEYDVCAICLDDYEEGDKLRILPCAHAYHCKCVDPWLTSSKRICPLCKRRVLSDDEDTSSSEDDDSDDERTPLVQASTASSPNSSLFATGFSRNNPIIRAIARQNRRSSTSSAETVSTSTSSDEEQQLYSIRTTTTSRNTILHEDSPQTSDGYQSQRLSVTPALVDTIRIDQSPAAHIEEDVHVLVLGGNRVSESSITVISDHGSPSSCISGTPEEHSYNSMDYHSLDDNSLALQTNSLNEAYSDDTESDIQDDIIVIAGGSKHTEQKSTTDA